MSGQRIGLAVDDVVGGRFRLLAELGEGGMSRVYEAVDLRYDRPAAVKVLARWLAEDDEFRERFEREARSAERAMHPHVLPVWDVGTENGLLFMVTPLCDTDLAHVLKNEGRLEPLRAVTTIAKIAWALDWTHERGVVHRDVKPENILLLLGRGGDHAYLGDFGLAKARVDVSLTQSGLAAGFTPAYAPPEQWLGQEIGPAADQYALAGTLHTCLAGRPPFHPCRGPALRSAHLSAPPPDLGELVAGIDEALAAAVARALAKDPGERFASCSDFVAAAQSSLLAHDDTVATSGPGLNELAGGVEVAAPPPSGAGEPVAPRGPPEGDEAGSLDEPARDGVGRSESESPPRAPIPGAGSPNGQEGSVPARSSDGPASVSGPTESEPRAWELGLAAQRRAARFEPSPASGHGEGEPPNARAAPPVRRGAGARAMAVVAARPRRLLLAALGAAAIGMAAAAALLLPGGGPESAPAASVEQIGVPESPIDLAKGAEGIWVASSGGRTITRITARDGAVRQRHVQAVESPFGVAMGDGRVWTVGPSGELVAVDPRTGRHLADGDLTLQADGIAAAFGAVWTFNYTSGTVTRIDVSSGRVGERRQVETAQGTSDIAVGFYAVWVINDLSGTLTKLDPVTGSPVREQEVGTRVAGVAAGEGAVWVGRPKEGELLRVDPDTWETTAIRIGGSGREATVAVGDGAAFYIDGDGVVTRVDPATNRRVGTPVRLAFRPRAAVVAERALWVADTERNSVARLGL